MKRNSPTHEAPAAEDDSVGAIKHAAAVWKARVDAGLSEHEQDELDAWLELDQRHRAALARFDSVWEKFDRPFHAGASDQLLGELRARASRRRRRAFSTVAGLIVLLTLGSVWRVAVSDDSAARATLATNAVLRMPARQTLPDGSVVELKAGAEIAVAFSSTLRRVTSRRGEAHFQVTKDSNRAFVVSAGGIEARAVGTGFSVQLRSTTVEVLVTEGHVAVNQGSEKSAAVSPPTSTQLTAPVDSTPIAVLGVGNAIVVDMTPPVDAMRRTSGRKSLNLSADMTKNTNVTKLL
ncbi:MAG: hypothetical protein EXS37_15360, partial [Opitutus sp.]|nr:hypothetical protein [Opitutus sp.]